LERPSRAAKDAESTSKNFGPMLKLTVDQQSGSQEHAPHSPRWADCAAVWSAWIRSQSVAGWFFTQHEGDDRDTSSGSC
jgi:hypothetical protein